MFTAGLISGFFGTFLGLVSAGFGQQIPPDQAKFDVASVKVSAGEAGSGRGRKGPPPFASDPTRLTARHLTLKGLISRAYGIDEALVTGGPGWIDSDRYDIDAAVEKPASREQMLVMLQALLADRFRLKVHRETKVVPQYVLAVGKNGPKFGPRFHAAETASAAAPGTRPTLKDGLKNYTMAHLAFFLTENRDWWDPDAAGGANSNSPPVMDQTGLTGAYDIVVNLVSRKDWLASFEQDTGLRIELRKISSELVMVDSVSKPAPN